MSKTQMSQPCESEFEALVSQVLASADAYAAAALHPWLEVARQGDLEQLIFAHRRHPRLFAQAPYTPASLLQRLAAEDDSAIRNKLVKNPATPADVLQHLAAAATDEATLAAIAAHPQAGETLLDSLERAGMPALRQALCHNSNTGLAQLRRLLPRATSGERKGMAKNPRADAALLIELWADDEAYLHAEIVTHPHCPPELLAEAVASEQSLLRRKAAENPRLSRAQHERLLSDAEATVRAAALRHLGEEGASLLDDPARRVRREQARQSELGERLIEKLSADEDGWVRRWIARNPVTPERLLRKLATDGDTEVRRGVARNPATPLALRRQLAADPQPWVRAGIAYRDDLDSGIVSLLSADDSTDVLAGLGRNPLSPAGLLTRIAGHRDRDVRRAVILNQRAPLAVLQPLLEDPYPLNRAQLCRHPALGSNALWRLIEDPEPQVRFTALQVLAARCSAGE